MELFFLSNIKQVFAFPPIIYNGNKLKLTRVSKKIKACENSQDSLYSKSYEVSFSFQLLSHMMLCVNLTQYSLKISTVNLKCMEANLHHIRKKKIMLNLNYDVKS